MYQATFVQREAENPLVGAGGHFDPPLRKEVIVERYRNCKLSEEVKYDTQGKTPSIRIVSCHPVPTDGGQQAHHFTSACQQPCCSDLCVHWQTKGT